jgi:hypothetical protein
MPKVTTFPKTEQGVKKTEHGLFMLSTCASTTYLSICLPEWSCFGQ